MLLLLLLHSTNLPSHYEGVVCFCYCLIKASLHVSSTGIDTLEVEKEGSCYLILLSSAITTKKVEPIRLVLEKKKIKEMIQHFFLIKID